MFTPEQEQKLLEQLHRVLPLLKTVSSSKENNSDINFVATHFTDSEFADLFFFFKPRRFSFNVTPPWVSQERSGVLLTFLDCDPKIMELIWCTIS